MFETSRCSINLGDEERRFSYNRSTKRINYGCTVLYSEKLLSSLVQILLFFIVLSKNGGVKSFKNLFEKSRFSSLSSTLIIPQYVSVCSSLVRGTIPFPSNNLEFDEIPRLAHARHVHSKQTRSSFMGFVDLLFFFYPSKAIR